MLPAFASKVALDNPKGSIRCLEIIGVEKKKALILSNSAKIFLLGKKVIGKFQYLLGREVNGRFCPLGLSRSSQG